MRQIFMSQASYYLVSYSRPVRGLADGQQEARYSCRTAHDPLCTLIRIRKDALFGETNDKNVSLQAEK